MTSQQQRDFNIFHRTRLNPSLHEYLEKGFCPTDRNLEEATVTLHGIPEHQEEDAPVLEEAKLAEITRVLGDIGHDIKNLLMPVLSGSALLQEELDHHFNRLVTQNQTRVGESAGRSKEILDMIRNNAHRIQTRVREIADAVKGVTTPLRIGSCDLHKIAGEVIETLHFDASQNGVVLQTEGLEALPFIQGDEKRLFNAFYNLINNAIPEVPSGGSVTVRGSVQADGQSVLVSVADTGRGMPKEILESLFTYHAMSRKAGGTGLGTKIVKDVVDAHNGTITVESVEGVGTTFHPSLPISESNS